MKILDREENVRPRFSFERNGSLSLDCVVPQFLQIDKKSLSYNKLPEEPLNLTVLKLDDSSFDIRVARTGTVAELKQAVEAAFSHMPKTGPGKVSWSHVWGHFCLSYDGRKLLTDTDLLGAYGIKDGDKLSFMRHVSISYNLVKTRSDREDTSANEPRGVLRNGNSRRCMTKNVQFQPMETASYINARSKDCQDRQVTVEHMDNHRQNVLLDNHQNNVQHKNRSSVVVNCESKLVNLFTGWFTYKLPSSGKRVKWKNGASGSHEGFLRSPEGPMQWHDD